MMDGKVVYRFNRTREIAQRLFVAGLDPRAAFARAEKFLDVEIALIEKTHALEMALIEEDPAYPRPWGRSKRDTCSDD